MIAKAKAISHGINDIRYITGESHNKKHPEKIYRVLDNMMVRPYRRYNKCSIGKLLGKCSNIYLSSPAYLPTKGRQGV